MSEYTVIAEISAAKISDDAELEKVRMRRVENRGKGPEELTPATTGGQTDAKLK